MSNPNLISPWKKIILATTLTVASTALAVTVFVVVLDGRMHASRIAVEAVLVIVVALTSALVGAGYALVSSIRFLASRGQTHK